MTWTNRFTRGDIVSVRWETTRGSKEVPGTVCHVTSLYVWVETARGVKYRVSRPEVLR